MKDMKIQTAARQSLEIIVNAAIGKKSSSWTEKDSKSWTRAVNALRKLAGICE